LQHIQFGAITGRMGQQMIGERAQAGQVAILGQRCQRAGLGFLLVGIAVTVLRNRPCSSSTTAIWPK
jgi:hypothetical protein